MENRTTGVTVLGILQVISAVFFVIIGVFLYIAALGLSDPSGLTNIYDVVNFLIMIWFLGIIVFATIGLPAAMLGGPTGFITVLTAIFIVWGILGFIATIGVLKLRRWALFLTPIHNVPLIALLILWALGYLLSPITLMLLVPILAIVMLVIVRGEFK